MLTYLFFLSPMLIYELTPICVLVAVLVNLAVLSKQNEVTAFKACGVSLYRMAMPILMASTLLSGGLFAFDHYYVPEANRKQDRLRDEIKGKPVQTYYRADRKWTMGRGFHIYYYRLFDPAQNMVDVNVYELKPSTFQLVRQIKAERARWNAGAGVWIFENGWSCDFQADTDCTRRDFQAATFRELTEPPGYFLKEYLQDSQMNFVQLDQYIRDLRDSGYGNDTVGLSAALPQVFNAAVCVDHGDDRNPLRIPGGEPGSHDGDRGEHRDRALLRGNFHPVRENWGSRPVAAGNGGVGAGCSVWAGGSVFAAKDEKLGPGAQTHSREMS